MGVNKSPSTHRLCLPVSVPEQLLLTRSEEVHLLAEAVGAELQGESSCHLGVQILTLGLQLHQDKDRENTGDVMLHRSNLRFGTGQYLAIKKSPVNVNPS